MPRKKIAIGAIEKPITLSEIKDPLLKLLLENGYESIGKDTALGSLIYDKETVELAESDAKRIKHAETLNEVINVLDDLNINDDDMMSKLSEFLGLKKEEFEQLKKESQSKYAVKRPGLIKTLFAAILLAGKGNGYVLQTPEALSNPEYQDYVKRVERAFKNAIEESSESDRTLLEKCRNLIPFVIVKNCPEDTMKALGLTVRSLNYNDGTIQYDDLVEGPANGITFTENVSNGTTLHECIHGVEQIYISIAMSLYDQEKDEKRKEELSRKIFKIGQDFADSMRKEIKSQPKKSIDDCIASGVEKIRCRNSVALLNHYITKILKNPTSQINRDENVDDLIHFLKEVQAHSEGDIGSKHLEVNQVYKTLSKLSRKALQEIINLFPKEKVELLYSQHLKELQELKEKLVPKKTLESVNEEEDKKEL